MQKRRGCDERIRALKCVFFHVRIITEPGFCTRSNVSASDREVCFLHDGRINHSLLERDRFLLANESSCQLPSTRPAAAAGLWMINDVCHIYLCVVKFNLFVFTLQCIQQSAVTPPSFKRQNLVCMLALCSLDKKKNNLKTHSTSQHNATEHRFFSPPLGQVQGGTHSCAASDYLTLLLTLRERLSVNQIRAAAQTSPGVRRYRASPTMLHCSLHIANPPQRSGGFQ